MVVVDEADFVLWEIITRILGPMMSVDGTSLFLTSSLNIYGDRSMLTELNKKASELKMVVNVMRYDRHCEDCASSEEEKDRCDHMHHMYPSHKSAERHEGLKRFYMAIGELDAFNAEMENSERRAMSWFSPKSTHAMCYPSRDVKFPPLITAKAVSIGIDLSGGGESDLFFTAGVTFPGDSCIYVSTPHLFIPRPRCLPRQRCPPRPRSS